MNQKFKELKFTSGPWQVDDFGDECFLNTNHRWGVGSNNSPVYRIAKVEGVGRESEGNAHLIASAPELFAENEKLRRAILRWKELTEGGEPTWEVSD